MHERNQKMLEERENYLMQLKKEKEKALKDVPEGLLRICCRGNKAQYYLRNNPKDFNGVYIRENDLVFAQRLAQKDYDSRILAATEKELKAIQKYRSCCPSIEAERNLSGGKFDSHI